MSIDVRPASVREGSAIAALAARTFALACPPDAPASDVAWFIATRLSPAIFAEYLADANRQIAVAARTGSLIGYTMLVYEAPPPEIASQLGSSQAAELSKIYVDAAQHGRGAAQALLDHAVESVRASGRPAIWLGTNQANGRAQRFYEKHGFRRVGTRRFRLGGRWEDDFVYELAL